jgi:hypothetical protein
MFTMFAVALVLLIFILAVTAGFYAFRRPEDEIPTEELAALEHEEKRRSRQNQHPPEPQAPVSKTPGKRSA